MEMGADAPHTGDGPPTDEIYLELRELESLVADGTSDSSQEEPAPVLPEDDPTGIKARIARLRALLADRGVDPPA